MAADSMVVSISSLAISPRYLQILSQDGVKPKDTHRIESLRSIFSAGSPLKAELYHYVRDNIKDVFIHNGSGRYILIFRYHRNTC